MLSDPAGLNAEERRWLLEEAHRLVAFAKLSALPGGGFGYLTDDGTIDPRPLELYVNARMTYVFSLAQAMGDETARPVLAAGIQALRDVFADPVHGGWYTAVTFDHELHDDSKTAYAHAFVILAAAAGAARRTPGAAELLHEALEVFQARFWDAGAGLARESWTRDWTTCESYRGVNANMHAVEAFLVASDVLDDPCWRERALQITGRVVNEWARGNSWRIPEHFDAAWSPLPDYNSDAPTDPFRPYGATVGHGMEWARLCLHLRAALGDSGPPWLTDAAVQLYDRARADGWQHTDTPGFLYTVDWTGAPVVQHRMHWVIAEATAAADTLYQATGDPAYLADFQQWWSVIRHNFIDTTSGSWRHELDATNEPSSTVWFGRPDVYHALQACLIPLLPLAPCPTLGATALAP